MTADAAGPGDPDLTIIFSWMAESRLFLLR
eukprot:COSAG01_NODE_64558_length_276_cov_0.581921_1_plen_29_part_01